MRPSIILMSTWVIRRGLLIGARGWQVGLGRSLIVAVASWASGATCIASRAASRGHVRWWLLILVVLLWRIVLGWLLDLSYCLMTLALKWVWDVFPDTIVIKLDNSLIGRLVVDIPFFC